MTTLLISGSRYASVAMLDYAEKAVIRAIQNDYTIIFGDADGIDSKVALSVELYSEKLCAQCYYVRGNCRIPNHFDTIYYHNCGAISYSERDRFMVNDADIVLCIWNGVSKGTKAVFDYAQAQGKKVWLKNFGGLS